MDPQNKHQHCGLGDTIASIAKWLGIEPKLRCGCKKRQAFWNWLVPYDWRFWGLPYRLVHLALNRLSPPVPSKHAAKGLPPEPNQGQAQDEKHEE